MILLIGFGNPFRRDDGAGPALALKIASMGVRSEVRVLTPQQLTPELAEELAAPDVSAVLFIDASVAGAAAAGAPAPDSCPALSVVESNPGNSCLGHHFSPSTLLAYSRSLYGASPPAWLLSVPGHDFGYGEGFSDETDRLLPAALGKAVELLRLLP